VRVEPYNELREERRRGARERRRVEGGKERGSERRRGEVGGMLVVVEEALATTIVALTGYHSITPCGLRRLYTILLYGEISVKFVNFSKLTSNYSKTKENE
jgi:hypothetical protein